jgi:hypothetical protein
MPRNESPRRRELRLEKDRARKVEVKLTPGVGGERRARRLRLTQLPFVGAAGSTIYTIQGETLTSLVLADWKALSRPGVRKQKNKISDYKRTLQCRESLRDQTLPL